MKNLSNLFFNVLILMALSSGIQGQTLTELAVPRFFGSKSGAAVNNTRTPFAVCLRIDGLLPGTVYDVKGGIALVSDPPTTFGAGNIWDGSAFSSSRLTAAFTTDASGSSGPFWMIFQPTGNSARFDAGQVHNLRFGYAVTGGTISGTPAFIGSKSMTALDIAANPRTATGLDDGAFIRGASDSSNTGHYMLLYDNAAGTGDPVFCYQARQADATQTSGQSDLPSQISGVYLQGPASTAGDYPAVIPAGSNNPGGIQRVESRNDDFSLYAVNTDADGIWPSGAATGSGVRREVISLTLADTPLLPAGPVLPGVFTDSVTVILSPDSVLSGGNVLSNGGDSILVRGLCWSTDPSPALTGSRDSLPGAMGPFSVAMTGLLPDTVYYYTAFAANSAGTAFGSVRSFATPCAAVPPLSGFTADDTLIFVGDTVHFYDSSLYCPDIWTWSFVGGLPMNSTLSDPPGVVFPYPGVFNICLTTTNSHGTHLLCKAGYITVKEPSVPDLVITEIMYNPPESGTDSLEYIELYNQDTAVVNLEGFSFSEGVSYTFPAVDVDPGSFIVVGKDDEALYSAFGISALKWASGSLTNSGELILLRSPQGLTVDSVPYEDSAPWDPLCNGHGYSLELCDPSADNALGGNWGHALVLAAVNAGGDSIWGTPAAACTEPPVARFAASDSAVLTGDSVVFSSLSGGSPFAWEWVFEGGVPEVWSGEIPPPVLYQNTGFFSVSLKVTNLAGQDLLTMPGFIGVSFPVALREGDIRYSVSPNPSADGVFQIHIPDPGHYILTLKNLAGTVIWHGETTGPAGISVCTAGVSGLYVLTVSDREKGTFRAEKLVDL